MSTSPCTSFRLTSAFFPFIRILSCLAYWCPLFAEVTYLPLLVFPFVKALMDAPLICFETIMTYFVNWCQDWFQLYPAPPFSILGEIDLILESMAPQLMAHFKIHQVSARIYAWALLESSFSDIFTKKEWFAIWDHVFTEHQNFNFLYAIVVAYSCVAQNALLRCSSLDDFQVGMDIIIIIIFTTMVIFSLFLLLNFMVL